MVECLQFLLGVHDNPSNVPLLSDEDERGIGLLRAVMHGDQTGVQQEWDDVMAFYGQLPILYVPLARGGAAKPAETKSEAKPTKADPSKMSAADILAAARGGSAAPAETSQPDPEPAAEEPQTEATAPEPAAEPTAEKEPVGDLPTSVDDILAFCRQRDGS